MMTSPLSFRFPIKIVHVLILVLALSCAGVAEARERAESPFRVDPWVDVPLTLVSTLLWGLPELVEPRTITPLCDPCSPQDVPFIDRGVIDYDFNLKANEIASHIVSGLLFTASYGLSLKSVDHYGWEAVFEDVVLLTQTLSVKGVLFQVVSRTVQRPRPVLYRDDVDPDLPAMVTSYRSFFSGHTASAFSAAVAASYIYSVRWPESRWRGYVWALSLTAASTVGLLRVTSGRHFWSDVLVGAIVGTSSGIIVPALHRVRGEDEATETSRRSVALQPGGIGIRFVF